MEPDDPLGDDEPHSRLLPPDDRLWRHPSEVVSLGVTGGPPARSGVPTTVVLVAAVAALAGAVLTAGLLAASGNLRHTVRVPLVERVVQASTSIPPEAAAGSPAVIAISHRLGPAVVGIEVEIQGVNRRIQGAGVMFRSDGHVLTNNHVVEGASRIVVVMSDGRSAEARLVGADPWSDIAVVKVDAGDTLPVATMGSAVDLNVGQRVVAIGGPAGRKEPLVEVGVVSALGRPLQRPDAPALLDMIQTTTPMDVAASGGALVDGAGSVVGIITALSPDGQARPPRVGLATPIDWARQVADQLLADGKVTHVWMGVEGGDLDAGTARDMGVGGGAVVTQVHDTSPAGDAGLQPDDVITSVDGLPVRSMDALRIVLRTHRPGDVLTLTIMRGADTESMKVRVAERPADT